MKTIATIKIMLVILFCFILLLNAQSVSYNQEFAVNTYTTGNQQYPGACTLEDSGFVMCWQSYGQDGSVLGIYGQIYEKDATPRGIEFRVNTTTNFNQSDPKTSGLKDGGFIVCWVSELQGGSGTSIQGQLYENDGSTRGIEFQINTTTPSDQLYPDVSALEDSGFVVCWASYEQGGNNYEIYAQIYESNGIKRGAEFSVNTTATDDQTWPRVSALLDSGFVVCWESYGDQDGDDAGIFAQIYERDGTTRGSEFQVNTYTISTQFEPIVSALEDSGFVITWSSYNQDGSSNGIYAQVFEQNGTMRGSEFLVNTYLVNDQSWSGVAGLPDSGFAVCWQSFVQDGSGYGIYAQLFESDGSKRGTEFQVNEFTTSNQFSPSISALNDGGLAVAWSSSGQDGSGDGVYAKYYLNRLVDPLQSFSLLEPLDEATLDYAGVDFIWSSANTLHINFPWEIEYKLYIDINSNFTDPDVYSDVYDTTYTVDVFLPDTDFYWKVVAKNIDGDSLWSSEVFTFYMSPDPSKITDASSELPLSFKLYGNYPNPFNPETTIKYALPADKTIYDVKLKIYDILGQQVVMLKNKPQAPGIYHVTWDGRNTSGNTVPSGVYFYVVEAGSFRASQKMLMIK